MKKLEDHTFFILDYYSITHDYRIIEARLLSEYYKSFPKDPLCLTLHKLGHGKSNWHFIHHLAQFIQMLDKNPIVWY